MTLAISIGAIQDETGTNTTDAILQIQRKFATIEDAVRPVFYVQLQEPDHPDSDTQMAFWLYTPPVGTAWALKYSRKDADGIREWQAV